MPLRSVPVVILNWNGWDDTVSCLASLTAAAVDDVIVVDNGSTTDRSNELRDAYPDVRLIFLGSNYGWAGGYNRVLALLCDEGYSAAYLLNNDTVVDPRFLAEAVVAFRSSDGRVAAVGSCIRYKTGGIRFDGDYHGAAAKERDAAPPRPVVHARYTNGSGMLIDLDVWRTVGPFDEAFFCYGEEHDWCRRAVEAGYELFVALDSVVWHESEGSDRNANAAYYRRRNLYLEAAKTRHLGSTFPRVRITYGLWRKANEARRLGLEEQKLAYLQAMSDGWRARFGKREPWDCPRWLNALAYTWPFRAGFFRRASRPENQDLQD